MKFARLGEAYLKQALDWLEMGRRALREKNYAFAVLASQECVEFSLKGALRKLGIEHPRSHDVGQILLLNKERLPKRLDDNLDRLMEISRRLSLKRSQAAYGNEVTGIPAAALFSKEEAETALREASWTLILCKKH